jgi:hypothetical protein
MTEAATTKQEEVKEDGLRKPVIVLQIFALFFFILSLTVTIVIMLLPLGDLPGKFPGSPARTLWLLLTFGIVFAIALHLLGAPQLRRRKYSMAGGITSLTLGVLNGVEIFLLKANGQHVPTSLWWLFTVLTVLGAIGVYLPDRATRLKEQEEKRKAQEALLKKRTGPKVLRLKPRRYYVYESKILVYKHLIRSHGK